MSENSCLCTCVHYVCVKSLSNKSSLSNSKSSSFEYTYISRVLLTGGHHLALPCLYVTQLQKDCNMHRNCIPVCPVRGVRNSSQKQIGTISVTKLQWGCMNFRVKSLLAGHACLVLLKSQVIALKSCVKFRVKLQVLRFEFWASFNT